MIMNKKIAGTIILSMVVSANMIPVYGAGISEINNDAAAQAEINKGKDNDIIVDSSLKEFDNLNKVYKYFDYDYKVPDYAMNNFKPSLIRIEKYNDGNRSLQLEYVNKSLNENKNNEYSNYVLYGSKMNDYNMYSVYEFKGYPEQCLKDIKYGQGYGALNINVLKEKKQLGQINGMYITLTANVKEDNDYNTADSEEICRFYVFEKDNIYYAVDLDDFKDDDILNSELNKIASSLKKIEDLTNISYEIEHDNSDFSSFDVYDKEDLVKAAEIVGFTPKFIPEINGDIKITDCNTFTCTKIGQEINTFQCNYSYKDKGIVVFIQEKGRDNYRYNDLINGDNSSKTDFEKLSWDNVDVYKYFDDGDNKYIYQWKIGDIYYFFETYFDGEKENVDDIARTLFDAK